MLIDLFIVLIDRFIPLKYKFTEIFPQKQHKFIHRAIAVTYSSHCLPPPKHPSSALLQRDDILKEFPEGVVAVAVDTLRRHMERNVVYHVLRENKFSYIPLDNTV